MGFPKTPQSLGAAQPSVVQNRNDPNSYHMHILLGVHTSNARLVSVRQECIRALYPKKSHEVKHLKCSLKRALFHRLHQTLANISAMALFNLLKIHFRNTLFYFCFILKSWNDAPETWIILIARVTPINSIRRKQKSRNEILKICTALCVN